MNQPNKRGPWSAEEKMYMEENAARLTPKQMGEYLQRDPEAIERYIKGGMYGQNQRTIKTAENYLLRSPTWEDLKQQFTKEELDMFLYHWGRIISQFKDDVLPTEELQIIDTIKLDILMNRILRTQYETNKTISELELKMVQTADLNLLDNYNRQLGILRASLSNTDKTYQDMLSKKEGILKSMKATRDSRVKVAENSRQNFTMWLRQIIEDKDTRKELGLYLEKMRIATEFEIRRLSEYHKYADGALDQPLLNAETANHE
jgi:hypothetical protein